MYVRLTVNILLRYSNYGYVKNVKTNDNNSNYIISVCSVLRMLDIRLKKDMPKLKTKDDIFWYFVNKESEWEESKNYKPPAPPKPFKIIPLKSKASIWAFCKELLTV